MSLPDIRVLFFSPLSLVEKATVFIDLATRFETGNSLRDFAPLIPSKRPRHRPRHRPRRKSRPVYGAQSLTWRLRGADVAPTWHLRHGGRAGTAQKGSELDIKRVAALRFFSFEREQRREKTMDKVSETSAVSKNEGEKIGEPKTRKRPATSDRGESESKKPREVKICEEHISKFELALAGMHKGWDRASAEGRKLSTLMRDTDDWIVENFKPDTLEFMKVSAMDKSKAEIKGRYDRLWEKVWTGSKRFDALKAMTKEAIEMVRDGECEEDLLKRLKLLTGRMDELRESY